MKEFKIYGPVEKENKYVFDQITEPSQISLDYDTTILPPKKYLLPQEDKLFSFKNENNIIQIEKEAAPEPRLLFGLHACDINAIRLLDKVYLTDYHDEHYIERRENTYLIGISCTPSDTCFCRSFDMDFSELGFDMFFTDIGENYYVRINSAFGNNLLDKYEKFFFDITEESKRKFREESNKKKTMFKRIVNTDDLPELLSLAYESTIWEELGEKCMACGNCSFVCPTCYCYDVNDKVELDLHHGERVKTWDSCLLLDFSRVAGGFNFRGDRAKRIRNRYYHKEKAFPDRYGRPACVGCGRCIRACPAGIDVTEVIKLIRGDIL